MLQPWIDAVSAILKAGTRFGDQVAPLVTTTWNSDRKTTPIKMQGDKPIAVLCLAASSGARTFSPVTIAWTWDAGALTITAAPSLDASTDWALTLLPVRG